MNSNKYFRELTLNLQRAGFTVGPEADNLLPVELDGERLCVATEGGSIRYRKEDVTGEARTAALDKVTDIVGVTAEYPIWWGEAPRIINTFWESYDLSGKTIAPFCTSASSPLGSSATKLQDLTGSATWLEGRRFSGGASRSTVESWVNGLGLTLTPAA